MICGEPECERPSCLPEDYAPLCTPHYLASVKQAGIDAEKRLATRVRLLVARKRIHDASCEADFDYQGMQENPCRCADRVLEETCIRTSGEALCPECGQEYWRHPQPAKELVPTLVRACDGRLLKL